jgi:predicted nucleic acid-binding protein
MSRVFVARENALSRNVVVTVLAPALSASVSAERITREIATAARLQQANMVPVLAAGTSGGVHDLQIAATALVSGSEVATLNVTGFGRVPGLAVAELAPFVRS